MQACWRRLINQGVIGQLWPPRPQPVEHILLLLGLLARTNWRGEKKDGGKWTKEKQHRRRKGEWKIEGGKEGRIEGDMCVQQRKELA